MAKVNEDSLSPAKKIEKFNAQLKASSKQDVQRIDILLQIGDIHLLTASYEQVMAAYQEALTLANEQKQNFWIARTTQKTGFLKVQTGQIDEGISLLLQTADYFKSTGQTRFLIENYNQLGIAYAQISDYFKSPEYLYKALQLAEDKKNEYWLAETHRNLGIFYTQIGDFPKALDFLEKSVVVAEKLNSQVFLGNIYNNLGGAYLNLKDFLQAKKYFDKSIQIREQLQQYAALSGVYQNLSLVYVAQKDYAKAQELLEKALKIGAQQSQSLSTFSIKINLANVLLRQNKLDKAEEILQENLPSIQKTGLKSLEKDVMYNLAEIYKSKADYQKALAYYERYKTMEDSMYFAQKHKLLAETETRFALQSKEKEMAMLQSEKESLFNVNQVQKLAIINNQLIIISLSLLFVVLVSVLIFVYYRIRLKNKLNQALEIKIAERTQKYEMLNEALQKTNQELDTFLYKASHDLRGPLASIDGLANIGLMETQDEKLRNCFQLQKGILQKTEELLFRVIEIGEIRNHKIRLENTDLKKYINKLVRSHNRTEGFKFMDFKISVADGILLTTDFDMLDIVLDNLVRNAIQNSFLCHNDSTNSRGLIAIEVVEKPNRWEINITDNGKGITEEVAPKVFDMFFRGTDGFQGFGLGLYKSNIAISKIKGSVELVSYQHNQTCFKVTLPKQEALAKAA